MDHFVRVIARSPKGGGGGGGHGGGGGGGGGHSSGSSGSSGSSSSGSGSSSKGSSSSSKSGGTVIIVGSGGYGPAHWPLWQIIVFSLIGFFFVLFISVVIFLAVRDSRRRKQGKEHKTGGVGWRAFKITFGIFIVIWLFKQAKSLLTRLRHRRRAGPTRKGTSYSKLEEGAAATAANNSSGSSAVGGAPYAQGGTGYSGATAGGADGADARYEPMGYSYSGFAAPSASNPSAAAAGRLHLPPPPTPATIAPSPFPSPNLASSSGASTPNLGAGPFLTPSATPTPSPAPPPPYPGTTHQGGGAAAEYFSAVPLGGERERRGADGDESSGRGSADGVYTPASTPAAGKH